jgi:hypothetical protein
VSVGVAVAVVIGSIAHKGTSARLPVTIQVNMSQAADTANCGVSISSQGD